MLFVSKELMPEPVKSIAITLNPLSSRSAIYFVEQGSFFILVKITRLSYSQWCCKKFQDMMSYDFRLVHTLFCLKYNKNL